MNKYNEELDLLGIPCPQNTAKALIFLEIQETNSKILIKIDDGEPINNFLASLEIETGYEIIGKQKIGHYWELIILKTE